jgi:hypothetical protein
VLFLLIIAGILLELIILVIIVYFVLKHFPKSKRLPVFNNNRNVMPEIIVIRDNVEKESRKRMVKSPNYVYTTLQQDRPAKSDGDLIPYGLTEKEKETLNMFYSNNDN